MESASVNKNKLVTLEGGDGFASYLDHQIKKEASELRNEKGAARANILSNIYDHYRNEWAKIEGKEGKLSAQEIEHRSDYISNISPDEILALLKQWQVDWGSENYDKLDQDDKTAIDAADDLISEIGTW